MNQIKIELHINRDHRDYAAYDNKRNIAHIADGLKPSTRKIIFTAINTVKANTEIKVANLGSRASDLTHYQHGEDSIIDAVVGLAQDFTGSNNFPLLLKKGQFGTKMDYENSEPRYIYVKRHSNMDKVLDSDDDHILPEQFYDGEQIEPEFYLPKVPLLLLNGSRGVGNGYSSRILPRSLESVKAAIKSHLKGEDYDLPPSFDGFKGKVERVGTGEQFKITGCFERPKKLMYANLIITDLPPDSAFQYANYKNRVLLKLMDSKQIKSITDLSSEKDWKIHLKVPQEFLKLTDEKIVQKLGLVWNITETLNCWGWDGKLKMFNNIKELLGHWIEGRLGHLNRRRLNKIERLNKEASWLAIKRDFINLWNQNSTQFVKMAKPELSATIRTYMPLLTDEEITRLLQINLSSLISTETKALDDNINSINAKINVLEMTTPADMMLTDLDSI